MPNNIILNRPLCDYITITSFEANAYNIFRGFLMDAEAQIGKMAEHFLMQYVGLQAESYLGGHAFVGSARIKDRMNAMLSVSGRVAHVALRWILNNINFEFNTTRIDLQMTCEQLEWNQKEAERSIEDNGKMVSKLASKTGMTLYIGSWSSDRFTRIYEKKSDDGQKLIRFESVFKKQSAPSIMTELKREDMKMDDIIGNILKARVIGSDYVTSFWLPKFSRFRELKIKSVKVGGNTEKWLRETVLPSLSKYAFSHDADHFLLQEFQKVINYAVGWGDGDNHD